MNNQIKLKSIVTTRPEMEALVRDIAGLKLNEKLLLARMDGELQAVRERYQGRMETLARVLAEKTGAACAWAEANPEEFGRRRSVDFRHGVAGFRLGPPRLKTALKWKWDGVLQALRELPWGRAYIRVKEEINKEQLIADAGAGTLSEADLRKAGTRLAREETFYVEPRLTKMDDREVA